MDLREVNTDYSELLAGIRSFHRERDTEVIRLRQIGANYSYWEEQLNLREQQLNGREQSLGEWEADLKGRERRVLTAKAYMESSFDKKWQVS